jgi:hypothetical protein
MRLPLLLPSLLAACAAGAEDADHDGIPAAEDCDDADPFVYPGAPDDPGDGVDADCDGTDPQHPFVGEWQVDTIAAYLSTFSLVDPGTEAGTLTLDADLSASLDATIDIDPDLVGYQLTVPILMTGLVSPLPGTDGESRVSVGGDVLGEQSFVDLDCVADGDALVCEGVLKALDAGLAMEAVFVR